MGKTYVAHGKPLQELQWEFMPDMAALIVYGNLNGCRFRPGDFYRDPRSHGAYGVKQGYAAAYSNHKLGIAGDLPLFLWDEDKQDWVYQTRTDAYTPLGEYWESLRPENVWGGHWADGNHFSKWYDGRW